MDETTSLGGWWDELPLEILYHVFYYLNTSALVALRAMNKSWNLLLKDDNIWKSLLLREYNAAKKDTPKSMGNDWSEVVLHYHKVNKRWEDPYFRPTFRSINTINASASSPYTCLRFRERQRLVWAGTSKGIITSWKLMASDATSSIEDRQIAISAHSGPVNCIRLKRGLLLSCSTDGTVQVAWRQLGFYASSSRFGTDVKQQKIKAHSKDVVGLETIDDVSRFITCSLDGYLKLWDMNKFSLISDLRAEHNVLTPLTSITWKDENVIVGIAENKILLWDLRNNTGVPVWSSTVRSAQKLNCVEINDNYIVVGGEGRTHSYDRGPLWLYDLGGPKRPSAELYQFRQTCLTTFSSQLTGNRLVTGHTQGVYVWENIKDIHTGPKHVHFLSAEGDVKSLQFSTTRLMYTANQPKLYHHTFDINPKGY